MPSDRPDPSEFFAQAQRMLRELFGDTNRGDTNRGDDEPWAGATRSPHGSRGLSAEEQRENLTFALATRAVEALEDLALNVAAIRQGLERARPRTDGTNGGDATAT
ncbi:MAG: uncharacterized protein JWQ99_3649 [Blastococcus sp.]|nr:uncharacterized protein [Blastococcus sp.]